MFYSHEVLTSRKYGVATIWLVATLGSRSGLKKVNRKEILNVNVVKACETIITPQAPLALRLMGNLLYGVSKVYNEQWGYVLTDAQSAQHSMRMLLKVVHDAQLDPEAGRTRPETLLLRDDPAFLPDLVPMDLDTLIIDDSTTSSQISSLLSPHSDKSLAQAGLLHFSSDTSVGGGVGFTVQGDLGPGAMLSLPPDRPSALLVEDDGFLPEADFGFDAEGNFIDYGVVSGSASEGLPATPMLGRSRASGAVTNLHARPSHHLANLNEAMQQQVNPLDMESVLLPSDDLGLRQSAEPFSLQQEDVQSLYELPAEEIVAPVRRKKHAPREIPLDQRTQLANQVLQELNNNYINNMAIANAEKARKRVTTLSKKVAEHFVIGQGIGGLGVPLAFGLTRPLNSELSVFSGASLLRMLGIELHDTPSKRGHEELEQDDEQGEDSSPRRRKTDVTDVGRGLDDDAMDVGIDPGSGPRFDDIEVARDAPTPVGDISSAMPWNVSASKRGSVAPGFGSALGGGIGSAGGPSSTFGGTLSEGMRRGSRMISASPLGRRGDVPPLVEQASSVVDDGGRGFEIAGGDEEQFELYGPSALVDTQTATDSLWRVGQFEQQTRNFKMFVEENIQDTGEITFENLLPLEKNSRIVAAQGLLHVLTLASQNAVIVAQEEAYGPISLRLNDAES